MISSRDQRRIFLLPGKTRSVSESRLQDISTIVKQDQQDRLMRRHPDRSCTYLVLRATPDEQSVQLKPALKFPQGGASRGSSLDQHLDKHWLGGAKIKMTLRMCDSQGKKVIG